MPDLLHLSRVTPPPRLAKNPLVSSQSLAFAKSSPAMESNLFRLSSPFYPGRSSCSPPDPKIPCLYMMKPPSRNLFLQDSQGTSKASDAIVLSSVSTSIVPRASSVLQTGKGNGSTRHFVLSNSCLLILNFLESKVDLKHSYLNLFTQLSTVMDAFTIISSKVKPTSDVGKTIIMNHQRLKCLSKRTIIAQLSAVATMIAEFAASLIQFSSLSIGDQARAKGFFGSILKVFLQGDWIVSFLHWQSKCFSSWPWAYSLTCTISRMYCYKTTSHFIFNIYWRDTSALTRV